MFSSTSAVWCAQRRGYVQYTVYGGAHTEPAKMVYEALEIPDPSQRPEGVFYHNRAACSGGSFVYLFWVIGENEADVTRGAHWYDKELKGTEVNGADEQALFGMLQEPSLHDKAMEHHRTHCCQAHD